MSYDMNLETYMHELKHIYYNDFEEGNVGNMENSKQQGE